MSASSTVGKAWCKSRALSLAPSTILDIGVGKGTYHDLLSKDLPSTFWIGVEVFEPYAVKYKLREKYDQLIIADARYVDWAKVGKVDLTICGDVLEHMTKPDARELWEGLLTISDYVLASLPIVEYPQGVSAGNIFETHVATWSKDECLSLPGIVDSAVYSEIGVFLAEGGR